MATLPHLHRQRSAVGAPDDSALDEEPAGGREFIPIAFDTIDDAAYTYVAPRPGRMARYRVPLVATLLGGALIAATWLTWTPTLEGIADGAGRLADQRDGRAQWSATVGIAALGLLVWAGAWGRATHPRRPVRLSGGRGRIAVDAIAGGLRTALLDIPEVREAEVRVENRRRGRVLVRAWLRVTPQARIDDMLDDVDGTAEWLVEEQLRLVLAEPPLVDVRYDELDLRPRRERVTDPESDETEDA